MSDLHRDAVVFDGLIVSRWGRDVFADMAKGGVTAANCTVCVWENFTETMRNIARFKQWFQEHDDIIVPARTVADIRQAKVDRRTALVLGFQNVSAFEDQIGYVELFKDVGVGIAQMAYNTQNLVGTGCYETPDRGLSDFGHDIVAEMNRVGMMCDLSHVGPKTSDDVIRASEKPVCYSHCLPAGLKAHPRNKSDEQLLAIADAGGFVGVTMFPPFLKQGVDATVDDYVAAIDYVVNLIGEESVGIGTDFTQGHDDEFFRWITHDKGNGRKLTDFGEIINPKGLRSIAQFPNLTKAMERAKWPERKIRNILGENWLRVLGEVWGG